MIDGCTITAIKDDSKNNLAWHPNGSIFFRASDSRSLLEVLNSKIIQKGTAIFDDSQPPLIDGLHQNVRIENSTLEALNHAILVKPLQGITCVNRSTLKGQHFGGLHAVGDEFHIDGFRNIGEEYRKAVSNYGCAVIKDSTIGFSSTTGHRYSCYIGYDSTIYFDGCEFVTNTGAFGVPAIRWDGTSIETKAYFSNCKMGGIRVDGGCKAYLGQGIADSVRNASVSGTIINTDETYRKTVGLYIDNVTAQQIEINNALEARIKALEDIINAETSASETSLLSDDTAETAEVSDDTTVVDTPLRWTFDEESGINIPTE